MQLSNRILDAIGRLRRSERFEHDAVETLKQAGIDTPQPGIGGTVPVTPDDRAGPPQIQYKETSTLLATTLNQRPTLQSVAPSSPGENLPLPCFSRLPCRIQPWCCTTNTEWIPPQIDWLTHPNRIPDAEVFLNPLNARVEGEIQTRFQNNSKEGKKKTITTCECRGGDEGTQTETIDGSATLDADQNDRVLIEDLANELLDEVKEFFNGVEPDVTVETTATFEKHGAWDTIKAIFNILTSGSMDVNAEITSTVTYPWRGQTRTEARTFNVNVRLPVDNVDYSW